METIWTGLAVCLIAVVLAAIVVMAGVFEGIMAALDDTFGKVGEKED